MLKAFFTWEEQYFCLCFYLKNKRAEMSVRKVVWKNVYNLSFWDVTPSSKNKVHLHYYCRTSCSFH